MLFKRSTWLESALALAAVLPVVGGCGGNKVDGFSNEEWDRVAAMTPLSESMIVNPFDKMRDDDRMARFGQQIFWDKRGAEAIQVDGPSGKAPYTPIDPATGMPAVDPVTMMPRVIPGEKGKVSCGTCHGSPYLVDSRTGFTTSHGRTWLGHNTPTMVNLGYLTSALWTGRFDSLREHGAGAMGGNSTTLAQIHYINTYYKDTYNSLFPDTPLDPALDPTAMDAARFPATGNAKGATTANGKTVMSADGVLEKMAKADRWAVAQFRGNMGILFEAHPRKLLTPGSPFERYVREQDSTILNEKAKNGLRLFIGKASCVDCHNGPALTDNQFHNIGVPTQQFAPGTTNPGVPDRGRGGVLAGGLNNQLMQLRTNDMIPDVQDQVMIYGGAGQFSDKADVGRQRLESLDAASCVNRSTDMADISVACQQLFYPGAPGDDTKTPPVAAKPADPRLDTCLQANATLGVCTKYDDSFEGSFRTPILLNVAETAPYFHTGEAKTLRDVVIHYNNGGGPVGTFLGTKSPRLRPLGLNETEIDDLVEFLKSLTGSVPDPNWTCDLSLPRAAPGVAATFAGACAAE